MTEKGNITISMEDENLTVVEKATEGCLAAITNKFEIFNVLVFEFLGMLLFSYCVIWGTGIITYPGIFITLFGMFLSLVISGSFGCGHINPAITLAFMIKK